MEAIKPPHYQIEVSNWKGKTIKCDYFDIGNALGLSLEQFNTLRYMRKKGGYDKQINDTKKAIECLNRHLDNLNRLNNISKKDNLF